MFLYPLLTAIVKHVQLLHIIGAHFQALTNHILELWSDGDNGRSVAIAEGILSVVHHGIVVIWSTQCGGIFSR